MASLVLTRQDGIGDWLTAVLATYSKLHWGVQWTHPILIAQDDRLPRRKGSRR